MLEKRSVHIEELARREDAIARQFVASSQELECVCGEAADPLQEEDHEVVSGMIHKYGNRVLCLLTAECAAYCRFCTRRRNISDAGSEASAIDIDHWAEYLSAHTEVKEVILSGGDPFIAPTDLFRYAIERISSTPSITVLRIGTRAPVSDPELVSDDKLRIIQAVRQPVYVGIHFNHPAELTEATIESLSKLRKVGAILYSQTVFLAGINDDYNTLYELFTRLIEVGVRPYYLYRCDPVAGAGHFRTAFAKERNIVTRLRKNLSGLACPTYVIDTPFGSGKIPVPLEFWDADMSFYRDFCGEEHQVEGSEAESGRPNPVHHI